MKVKYFFKSWWLLCDFVIYFVIYFIAKCYWYHKLIPMFLRKMSYDWFLFFFKKKKKLDYYIMYTAWVFIAFYPSIFLIPITSIFAFILKYSYDMFYSLTQNLSHKRHVASYVTDYDDIVIPRKIFHNTIHIFM